MLLVRLHVAWGTFADYHAMLIDRAYFRIVGVVELVTKSRSLIGFGRMVHLSHVPPTRPPQLGRVFQDTRTHLYYVIKLAIVPPENIQTPVSVVVGGCGCWLLQLS